MNINPLHNILIKSFIFPESGSVPGTELFRNNYYYYSGKGIILWTLQDIISKQIEAIFIFGTWKFVLPSGTY